MCIVSWIWQSLSTKHVHIFYLLAITNQHVFKRQTSTCSYPHVLNNTTFPVAIEQCLHVQARPPLVPMREWLAIVEWPDWPERSESDGKPSKLGRTWKDRIPKLGRLGLGWDWGSQAVLSRSIMIHINIYIYIFVFPINIYVCLFFIYIYTHIYIYRLPQFNRE